MHVTCTTNNKYWKEKCQPFPVGGGGDPIKAVSLHPPHPPPSTECCCQDGRHSVSSKVMCNNFNKETHSHAHNLSPLSFSQPFPGERGGGERERERDREKVREKQRDREVKGTVLPRRDYCMQSVQITAQVLPLQTTSLQPP